MPTIDNWRSTLMRAAINCPHGIVDSEVLLQKSGKQSDGNALSQLADRLAEAVKPLLDERDRLEKALALVQQHHATAWNRGHTIGMAAQEETARKALDAVKADAWGNAQLTEALLAAEAERDRLAAEAQHAADVAEAYKAQAESLAAEVEALRGAISKACAGYPADNIAAPTCVQILREVLDAAMKVKP